MKELPLVFFTVLAQAAAGGFLLLIVMNWLGKLDKKQWFTGSLLCLGMVMVAGVSAIFHLGHPFRALNAIFGVGRSPMSNEILICALFGAFLFAHIVALKLEALPNWSSQVTSVIAALSGFALISTIPQVYQLETIPAWNTPMTSLQMVITSVICGGAFITALTSNKWACALSSIAIILLLALVPSYFSFLGMEDAHLSTQDLFFWGAKYALLLLGMVLMIIHVSQEKVMTNRRLPMIAVGVIVVAELAGRIGFYDLWAIGM